MASTCFCTCRAQASSTFLFVGWTSLSSTNCLGPSTERRCLVPDGCLRLGNAGQIKRNVRLFESGLCFIHCVYNFVFIHESFNLTPASVPLLLGSSSLKLKLTKKFGSSFLSWIVALLRIALYATASSAIINYSQLKPVYKQYTRFVVIYSHSKVLRRIIICMGYGAAGVVDVNQNGPQDSHLGFY